MDRVKRIWYLSLMRAAKVQASLRIHPVSPEPSLLSHTSSESRGTFRQKARSLAPLNGWACAVKNCHNGILEDTNSLDRAHIIAIIALPFKLVLALAWFPIPSSWNPACYIRGLIHGIGWGVPNGPTLFFFYQSDKLFFSIQKVEYWKTIKVQVWIP